MKDSNPDNKKEILFKEVKTGSSIGPYEQEEMETLVQHDRTSTQSIRLSLVKISEVGESEVKLCLQKYWRRKKEDSWTKGKGFSFDLAEAKVISQALLEGISLLESIDQ